VKLSNSSAITCVPRLELNGPALRHFESQPDSPRINQRFLNCYILALGQWISLSVGAHEIFIASGFALAVDKYIIKRCVLGAGTVSPGPCQIIQINDRYGYNPTGIGDGSLFLGE
jgi:hypothetical protein